MLACARLGVCGASLSWQWGSYASIVESLLARFPNLYISFTPELVAGRLTGITKEDALELATHLAGRVMLGTTVRGVFTVAPPEGFDQISYADEVKLLRDFADEIEQTAGKAAAAALRYRTACFVFNLPPPSDPDTAGLYSKTANPVTPGTRKTKNLQIDAAIEAAQQSAADAAATDDTDFLSALAYGGGDGGAKARRKSVCPPSQAKTWDTIDCHLHLLDFLQKSSGTSAALKAMDGCQVRTTSAASRSVPPCKYSSLTLT
jgi:hypothetical protein